MDLAADLGGSAVVLHVGDVWELHGEALALRRLFRQGMLGAPEYASALDQFKARCAACQQPSLDSVARSLEALAAHARSRGLQLGIENRYYVNEIPNLEQALWLMDRADPTVIGYWHDVGHAEVVGRMGFAGQRDWLDALGSRIKGVHLHDVLPGSITDHQAAGLGDLDLAGVVGYVPPTALRVCEFDRRNTEDEVRAGIRHLADLGFFPDETGRVG
jgi:sugar phosphate isomerase/epimerase